MRKSLVFLFLFFMMIITSCGKNEDEYYYFDQVPESNTSENNENDVSPKKPTYSIIGNSISTFKGYIPSGYKTYYPQSWFRNVNDTWWMRIGIMRNMIFLSNASWSASTVSGNDASCFTSDERISYLSANGVPDYIFVAGGTNDYGKSKLLGTETDENDYNKSTFRGAYSLMLNKMKEMYPNTTIICLSIFPRKEGYDHKNSNGWTIREANAIIQSLTEKYNCIFINMEDCGLGDDYSGLTFDGLHPNSKGMEILALHICKEFDKAILIMNNNKGTND